MNESIMDWKNKRCTKCLKPLVEEAISHQYGGWRLDCKCWDEVPETREQKLEAIVRRLMPATREIMWCALAWNDHNFDQSDLLAHISSAAKSLGFKRGDSVDGFNEFMSYVDEVLGGDPK